MSDRIAGLPDVKPSAAPPAYADKFVLPANLVGKRWEMESKYLTFYLDEITPRMQDAAAKAAGGNSSKLQQELIFRSLCWIGDRNTVNDHDFKVDWWNQIGSKCRVLVTTAFGNAMAPTEEELETFLKQ